MASRLGGIVRGLVVVLCAGALGGCGLLETAPAARFDVTPVVLYAGEAARFDASSSGAGEPIVAYSWAFGDGETAAGLEVSHAFAQPGRFSVSLQITDALGRTSLNKRDILVYVRSGTVLFEEDFANGASSLDRWVLDPAWASAGDAAVENLAGSHGFALHIRSSADRWYRRSAPILLPPLREGQRLVFSVSVMTAHTQDAHAFFIFPARRSLESTAGALPYFVYTSSGGGSTLRVPDPRGNEETHLVPFEPGVYAWHAYGFSFSSLEYVVSVDEIPYATGPLLSPLGEGSGWFIVLGDESHSEACDAYFDDIRVTVEE